MENVVLVIHLLLAMALIGVVLLQRSEGGGLGIGGGGGGVVSGRSAATALGKITWFLAAGFIATSITLTIFAAQNSSGQSVIDRLGAPAPAAESGATDGALPPASDLLPPSSGSSGSATPLTPPRAE